MDAYAVINGMTFVQGEAPLTINVSYSAATLDGVQELSGAFHLQLPTNPALWRQTILDAVIADAAGSDLAVIRFLLMDLHTFKA